METTKSESRVVVEIRRFPKRPIYFKSGFLGGRMAKEVLILNPDEPEEEDWMCVYPEGLKKLPTVAWCVDIAIKAGSKDTVSNYIQKVKRPREIDSGVVVWRGMVGRKRIEHLKQLFKPKKRIEIKPVVRYISKWEQH